MSELMSREDRLKEISEEISDADSTSDSSVVDNDSSSESLSNEQPEKAETSPEQGDQEGEIKTLTDLANAIGLDPSQLYDLELKLAESGETVRLGSLKDELQSLKKTQVDFQKAKADFENERITLTQKLVEQQNITNQVTNDELKHLVTMASCQNEFSQIDWEEFEKLDAGKAALHQQRLLNKYNLAQQQYQQLQQHKHQYFSQQRNEYTNQQFQELLKLVPDWTDPAKFDTEVNEIATWAQKTYGYGRDVLAQIISANERDIVRKAYLYDKLQISKSGILKSSLKQIAGGKPIKPSDVKNKRVENLIQKARRSRNTADQIAAARAILDNS